MKTKATFLGESGVPTVIPAQPNAVITGVMLSWNAVIAPQTIWSIDAGLPTERELFRFSPGFLSGEDPTPQGQIFLPLNLSLNAPVKMDGAGVASLAFVES